jgi:hypothetical protein
MEKTPFTFTAFFAFLFCLFMLPMQAQGATFVYGQQEDVEPVSDIRLPAAALGVNGGEQLRYGKLLTTKIFGVPYSRTATPVFYSGRNYISLARVQAEVEQLQQMGVLPDPLPEVELSIWDYVWGHAMVPVVLFLLWGGFSWLSSSAEGTETVEIKYDDIFGVYVGNFAGNGLAILCRWSGECGYINEKGEVVIEPRFEQARDFAENGLARVQENEKWGYINEAGTCVIMTSFDDARDFSANGLAAVKVNEKYGYIDKNGVYAILPRFDAAWNFDPASGLAVVKENEKEFCINERGEVVNETVEAEFYEREAEYLEKESQCLGKITEYLAEVSKKMAYLASQAGISVSGEVSTAK